MLFVLTILITVLTGTVLYVLNLRRRNLKDLYKIQGPPLKPILGNILDIMISREELFKRDHKNCEKYFPIYKEIFLNTGVVCLLAPEDVEIVLSRMVHLAKSDVYDLMHMWLGTGLLTSRGKKWQSRRKILTPAFHFSILQEFIGIFNEGAQKLIQDLEKQSDGGGVINIVPPVTEFTLHAITETSMGTKLDDKSELHSNYKKAVYDFGDILIYRLIRPWLHSNFVFYLTMVGKKTKNVIRTLHGFSRSVIEERKNHIKSNSYSARKKLAMLDLLLKAKEENVNIDDEGIREEVDTFMFEGHDTTSVAICYILLVLANEKHAQDEIRQEIIEIIGDSDKNPTYADLQQLQYTERCIKECLRIYPSVPFIARVASEDFNSASGYKIPKGTYLNLHIFDIHRNPSIFPDPEKFDPDRFLPENISKRHPYAYIPFSAGPRNCIGQKYAMLELKAVLCGILRKFVLEPVTKREDLVFVSDLVLRTRDGIMVKFAPRK